MDFLRNNPVELIVAGALCIGASIFGKDFLPPWKPIAVVWQRLWEMNRLEFVVFVLGIGCLVAGLSGVYLIVVGPPGGEETVVEDEKDGSSDDRLVGLVQILEAPWDAFSERSDWPVAAAMAEVSLAAYMPPVQAEETFAELGYDKVSVISDGSLLGYVLKAEDATVIVFRGTDDPGDWIVNLDTRGTETRNGIVHRGFFEAYLRLSHQVNALLPDDQQSHIWITGHSLGGALAVMCAYNLSEEHGRSIDGLITFGQPMVARPPLTEKINDLLPARYVHFVNEHDIVTRIPPKYAHCGELVHFVGDEIRRSRHERLFGAAEPQETKAPPNDSVDALSEQEFAALKQELREEQRHSDFGPNGEMLYKGNSPLIRDHDMETYRDRMR